MGQLTSSEATNGPQKEKYSAQSITSLFQAKAISLLGKGEIQSVASKVNMNDITKGDAILTYTDLALLLNLSKIENEEPCTIPDSDNDTKNHIERLDPQSGICMESPATPAIEILYRSFTVLGRLPFLSGVPLHMDQLTIKKLLVALAVHLGRMSKIWPTCHYTKVVFISLALTPQLISGSELDEKKRGDSSETRPVSVGTLNEKSKFEAGSHEKTKENAIMKSLSVNVSYKTSAKEETETACDMIIWDSLDPLVNYDAINVDVLSVSAYDLAQIFTLLLVINSIPDQSHVKMQEDIHNLIAKKWKQFEDASFFLLRYFDIDITRANSKKMRICYSKYKTGVQEVMCDFFEKNFKRFLQISLFLSKIKASAPEKQMKMNEKRTKPIKPFVQTRLVDEATISLLNLFMKNIDTNVEVTPQNMVELYIGAQSGFSIRSLELKIFKWQAPTIFLVSGKRLKNKTIKKNKRYQQFDSEYPRHFRSIEDPRKSWQHENDRVTYAVFVKQPWRNSNKNNFGDEETAIMSILPRLDFFKSKRGLLTNGKLIYFNNQGMGVGFGNEQPLNKNNTRKHIPGSVSLTIEANLEFAVFRHIVNAGANTPHYFETSIQNSALHQDYEDRFVITDLEVWGVGSTKELEEQKKQWEWEEKQALARQGVNLRSLGEERAFLEMVGLVGNQGSGGSV
ncbi:restriction of telomere capping protein 5 [Metschnikowia bicuspidata var. bicuspidata NRRL YB-4993]|uniref:Restriction of telomere capping protein 5 n=1 Tax=Metschnikowia bicuspidata var. bicuspidata NRRL YB-4993 TaxID=869754 RepID=A0A1A0H682_9ASCO|nr:restriction of telomere capping protein 5 [Metschnikowia bicuspidata var. bicuspidata NRRL YB-4993]OBA19594.1 restriction of telomere capping protein 5 [Metschnikowia bicuspidata var. bicuspidata NRRL YB-4993]